MRTALVVMVAAVLIGVSALTALTGKGDDGPSEVTQDRAIELAIEQASFEPRSETYVQIRYVPRQDLSGRGGKWGVVLSDGFDAKGEPNRIESFLVDTATGEVHKTESPFRGSRWFGRWLVLETR